MNVAGSEEAKKRYEKPLRRLPHCGKIMLYFNTPSLVARGDWTIPGVYRLIGAQNGGSPYCVTDAAHKATLHYYAEREETVSSGLLKSRYYYVELLERTAAQMRTTVQIESCPRPPTI